MAKEKVVVGMSGGVDSSVAAYLLKEQGYEVVGVTMQIWKEENACETEKNGGCCGYYAAEDARRVAETLGIPHYVMNFRDVFQKTVIDDFVRQYLSGNTPNPCIRCNRYVKWEAMLARSVEIGASYIATGHYAKINIQRNGRLAVCKSVTEEKDQSYVLYNLTQYQLSHTLMPVGKYHKEDIREIARDIGLIVADKPDSQEICFIPDDDYIAFLAQNGSVPEPGEFVDRQGNILGRHGGIHRYTIGQRRGLGLSLGKPAYVCEIRPETNEVVIGDNTDTYTDKIFCKNISHMAVDNLEDCKNITAKIRYGSKAVPCKIEYVDKDKIKCCFSEKIRAAAPGQAAVFYQNDVVLGGGVIV